MTGDLRSNRLSTYTIPPKSGSALVLKKGQTMRIIDTEGEQVVDLVCFAEKDLDEHLSTARTIGFNLKLFLSTDDVLFSNWGNPMLTIVEDQVGRHDMLFGACNQKLYERVFGATETVPNCTDNLHSSLKQYNVKKARIPAPFNVFMRADINPDGTLEIMSPDSKAGEYIDLRAEQDLIVGLSTCPSPRANNNRFTSVEVEIYEK